MQLNSIMEVIRKYNCIHTHSFLDKAVSARKNKITNRKELENMFEAAKEKNLILSLFIKAIVWPEILLSIKRYVLS